MLIYKIFRGPEWAALQSAGQSDGAPIDIADGYIHFSTASQIAETAAKHFTGVDDLMLAAVDTETLYSDLRWEVSRGGQEFPHLYRKLELAEIVWAKPYPLVGASHVLPEGVA